MSDIRQLLVGLPETGKSTFLAALWYTAESGGTHWAIDRLGEDDEHLGILADAWLRCHPVGRSAQASQPVVAMRFRRTTGIGQRIVMYFPDLAGETFEAQWVDRHCSNAYASIARNASRILLFVHPGRLKKGERIEDYLQQTSVGDEGNGDAGVRAEKRPQNGATTGREPARDPTQVILVDLLQVLMRPPIGHRALRIAVVVSAWDLVETLQGREGVPRLSPGQWLRTELPLLDQFLVSNGEAILFESLV